MEQTTEKRKRLAKKAWQILIIILLNLALLATVTSPLFTYSDTSLTVLSRLGSRGDEVRQIQQALKKHGFFSGSADGIYGQQTREAVLRFQRSCGITADGIAGKQTLLYLGLGGSSSSGSSSSGKYSSAEIDLLAKVISGEARGEPYTGQVAVGAVILNRVQHASFPDSISGVVYQPGAFSCLHDSNWYQPVADSSRKAAMDAINGWDPSGGAIYYYNPKKTTNKFMHSRPVITTIGMHRFCK